LEVAIEGPGKTEVRWETAFRLDIGEERRGQTPMEMAENDQ